MSDAGGDTRDKVSEEVENAILPESKRAEPDAPVPASTGGSQPTEEIETDPEESRLPYPTDPTPGAVTALTAKTTKAQAKNEAMEPIPVGAWVKLADTDSVREQGGEVGTIAYVTESPRRLVQGGESDLSPRDHYIQADNIPLTVVTRDERRQTFLVYPEDLMETESSGRHAVLPHG